MIGTEKQNLKHLAVILDGNRRFAKKLMLKPWKGHEWGKKKVELLIDWCKEYKIEELTLYVFSIQNFNRPKDEFNYIMKLFKDTYTEIIKDEKKNIKIKFLGRTNLFSKEIKEIILELEERTKNNTELKVNIAMAYGGREELTDALKKIAEKIKKEEIKPEEITENTIKEHLYLQSEPDMIIRTGGEKRTSNFLMWQSNYSEWLFLDKPWPEFEKEDFEKCLKEYYERERRFGK